MKTITSVIAAAFCLAAGVVAATTPTPTTVTSTHASPLTDKTTLRQAFQFYHNIVNGDQLDKVEKTIRKHLDAVNLGYNTYKFRDYIIAVNADISNNCSFLRLSKTIDVESTKSLSEEALFSFFKNLVSLISRRVNAISNTPKGVKTPDQVKKWLIDEYTASSVDEILNTIDRNTPYFCFRSLIRTPGNLFNLQKLFIEYNKAKDKIEAEKRATETSQMSHPQQDANSSGTTAVQPGEPVAETTRSNADSQPSLPTSDPATLPAGSPVNVPSSSSGASTADTNTPVAVNPTQPSAELPTSSESTAPAPSDEGAASTAPIAAAGTETSGSTSTPAAGESATAAQPAGPTEQQPQDADSNTSGSSAPATGETTAPTEQQTQETTSNTSGSSASTTTGTTEQQAQQDAPQGENLKPAPTASSASFNGLAVAVLSVLVVSSM
ncbi:hypothetical protein BaOVIS_031080 [Babesia ovis]|uniref:Uncharacterized protein n=1 Tax=Babesia ovis TaxID=5869 RepID=A0A9W5TF61_BABOV|nr:hypothetical protein BaOVIS_031080 [Babesia ovis]